MKRNKVWLGVNAVVINESNEWLMVKKQYSGMKGMWSTPAGFVENGETADQAVIRELKEETGIEGVVKGIIGLRTGVINDIVSDNMILFLVTPTSCKITVDFPNEEIEIVAWRNPESLLLDPAVSPMVPYLINHMSKPISLTSTTSPGAQFNYTHYHLYT